MLPFWPINEANTFSIHQDGQVSDELADLQDQKSLTLC
jgi:hypothetical protein